MAKDFRSSVHEIASKIAAQLADELVALVHNSSMAEVFGSGAAAARPAPAARAARGPAAPSAPAPKKRGRPFSKPDSSALVSSIAALLGKNPDGLRAEQIRSTLKVDKPTVTRALTQGLATKALTKKGERRATKYYAK